MNQSTWQGKLRQIRGEVKREWGKFTHNDRSRIEGEFDRLLGQMQQQYGYTRERALNELERYWQDYGKPVQEAVGDKLGIPKRKPLASRIPWLGVAIAVLGVVAYLAKLQLDRQAALAVTPYEKKRKESIRQENERDLVDEQSWESFPASDPPASW